MMGLNVLAQPMSMDVTCRLWSRWDILRTSPGFLIVLAQQSRFEKNTWNWTRMVLQVGKRFIKSSWIVWRGTDKAAVELMYEAVTSMQETTRKFVFSLCPCCMSSVVRGLTARGVTVSSLARLYRYTTIDKWRTRNRCAVLF